jgi:hypothetical protein
VELNSALADGKNLDAKFEANGKPFLIECNASLTSDLATSDALSGYWNSTNESVNTKIRNKVLDKADQASDLTPIAIPVPMLEQALSPV